MTNDIIIQGWKRDYRVSAKMAEVYTDAILEALNGTYSTDNGETTFQGQSLSYVVDMVRQSMPGPRRNPNGLVLPGLSVDQITLFRALGFKVVKARGKRIYKGGKFGFGVRCDCVTL